MKTFKYLGTLLLLAMAGACSNEDEIVKPESGQAASDGITFTATFGVKNGTTRALSDPGDGTLTASWEVNEQIAIVFGGNKYAATVTEVDGEGNASVTATLPAGTPNNQAVTYIYPYTAANASGLSSDVLSAQDGTLATLSSEFDVATADGTLVVDGKAAQPNGTVTLVNQFAICKFQFTDENNDPITNIAKVTITDLSTTKVISVAPLSAQPAVYVAMRPSNNSTRFEVMDADGKLYKKTANAHLEAGMFYQPTFKTIFAGGPGLPLTFEAIEAGATIGIGSYSEFFYTELQYKINDGEWTEWTDFTPEITLANVGDKVSFRGDNYNIGNISVCRFSCSAPCYIYGNVMSVLYKENFATATTLPGAYTFEGMFSGNNSNPLPVYNHPIKDLLLPATTLVSSCYEEMFAYSCLSRAPELPAETLATDCYYRMFRGCTSLTTAPELRAETLAVFCYAGMFEGCTSLTTAPELPATTLADYCYMAMFEGCTSLTTAPVLRATTLAPYCYWGMFSGCSNLNRVECLATSFNIYDTSNWLDGVASTGTFIKAAGTNWYDGADGIPSGWTVVEK